MGTQSALPDGISPREAHGHSLRKTPEVIVSPIVMGMISKESKALSATRVFKSVYHRFFSSHNFLQCVDSFWRDRMDHSR